MGVKILTAYTTIKEEYAVPRKEIRVFADYMEHKIRMNEKKGHWSKRSHEENFKLLMGEVKELEDEVVKPPDKRNHLDIMMEAADVANYAMMIAWNCLLEATDLEEKTLKGETGVNSPSQVSIRKMAAEAEKETDRMFEKESWSKPYKERDAKGKYKKGDPINDV